MQIDLPLTVVGGALAEVAEAARRAEEEGFDGVSYSELSSDPLLHLTVAAGVTSRVDLISNITVAFARTPMLLAVQGRAIQEYSRGRLILGLGSQIKPHIERRFSMPWGSPAARMTEFVSAMRAIWHSWETGDALDFRGEFYTHTLMTPMFTPPSTVPAPKILLAAVGARMTEAAGAVADGLLIHPFSTERYVREVTLPALERGRAVGAAPRPIDEFALVGAGFIVTGQTQEEQQRSAAAVRQQLAFYGSTPAYRPVFELHGWGAVGDELNRLSKTADPGRWVAMGSLIDDDVLAAFAIVAEPDEVAPRLKERWGDLLTRYEINHVGVPSAELQLQIGRSLR